MAIPSAFGPALWAGRNGFDKGMIRIIGELNVGDKVRVSWTYDERLRAAKIQVVAKAKPNRTEKKTEDAAIAMKPVM